MQKLKEHYGKLTQQELLELDDLIYELQQLNGGPVKDRVQVPKFVPLPEPKNTKLWEYVMHMIKLFCVLPGTMREIRKMAAVDPYNTMEDLLEELPIQLSPFVMRYVWRKWEHRLVCPKTGIVDCGYVISTAKWAWMTWKASQKSVKNQIPIDEELDISRSKTGKVCTKNFK